MFVETNRNGYNIFPYKHLSAKRVVIQHPLTMGVRIKTGMGTAKTLCYKTSIFLAETAKSHIRVCNKLFQTFRFFNYHRTQSYFLNFEFWSFGFVSSFGFSV